MSPPRVLLSWSSGKDSAWALHVLREQDVEVVGLLTTFNEEEDRVSTHAVRRDVVEAQAKAAGVPLWPVLLPSGCSNDEYEDAMADVLARARKEGVTHVAFGDLQLEDVRKYREQQLAGTGLEPMFPLWQPYGGTVALAHEMQNAGLRARVTCVDVKRMDPSFSGSRWGMRFLVELPEDVDPCGENGEFHTVCYDGPMFDHPIELEAGELLEQDGFRFADFRLAHP